MGRGEEIESVSAVSRLRERYDQRMQELLNNPEADIEELVELANGAERVGSHEHNQIIKILKIDNDKYRVFAHNQVLGAMNGYQFKLLTGFAIVSGSAIAASGVTGFMGLVAESKLAENVGKTAELIKWPADQAFNSMQDDRRQNRQTAESRSVQERQEGEMQSQLVREAAQRASQFYQTKHEAKSGAANAIGGR